MYNKLFTKILDSTIWLESNPTRIVWITFLACMDEDGFVALSSVGNVAARARVTMEEAEDAIKALESPDTSEPNQDFEGRRVERVPYGWMVLNSGKYRDIIKRETVKEQTRARVAKHRAKKAGNAVVTHANEKLTPSDTDTDTDTDTETLPPSSKSASPVPPASSAPTPEERPSLETVVNPTGADVAAVPRETSKSVVRGKRFDPKGGLPEEWRLWCRQHRPDLAPQATFDSFSDFWVARAGAAGVKVDWFATWRNWCRKEKPGGSVVGAGGVSRQAQLEARNAAAMLEFVGGAK